ncbi:MAG TPA: hypothetical protein VH684_12340, partial [Xanthobacteraceae bacterium]
AGEYATYGAVVHPLAEKGLQGIITFLFRSFEYTAVEKTTIDFLFRLEYPTVPDVPGAPHVRHVVE